MNFLWAFLVGGLFCAAAQLVVDGTRLTPAHTMVLFVVLGAVLSAVGLYEPLTQVAGAGATIPLPSFGHALVQGSLEAARRDGPVGLVAGGLEATALPLTAAVGFGYLMAALFRPRG
ncbi:MAG TPA: stage V sporulation protein AE [Bacillota bacterium]